MSLKELKQLYTRKNFLRNERNPLGDIQEYPEGIMCVVKKQGKFVLYVQAEDNGTYDIWCICSSNRMLMSYIRDILQPMNVQITQVEDECWVKCSLEQTIEILDKIGVTRKREMTEEHREKVRLRLQRAREARM